MATATAFRYRNAILRSSLILRKGIQRSKLPVPSTPRHVLAAPTFVKPLAVHIQRCQFHSIAPWCEQRTNHKATTDQPPLAAPEALPPLPKPPQSSSGASHFAFAFDIDGVLLHSQNAYPPAIPTVHHLRQHSIPFLLLTNGGGNSELNRAISLSKSLSLEPPLSGSNIVQSHTPFRLIAAQQKLPVFYDPYVPGGRELKNAVLVVGGPENGTCRGVAEEYGFKNVVIPEDIMASWVSRVSVRRSSIWPFRMLSMGMKDMVKPLPRLPSGEIMPIDSIFVFNDPRDWGMNIQIILDYIIPSLSNEKDEAPPPPPLIFSNPDLLWASNHPSPRLGQGAFRAALEGTYRRIVEATRPDLDPQLKYICIGKPFDVTYDYAEDQLVQQLAGKETDGRWGQLKRVYMIGDNPLSDIQGANNFQSVRGVEWVSVLVKSGVYKPGQALPEGAKPRVVVKDVWEGVKWALEKEGWDSAI